MARFFRYVDAYLSSHPSAAVVLATDDARYHAKFSRRYAGRVLSSGGGFATRNVVRDHSIPAQAKGESALIDALLLAHCDFLLKGALQPPSDTRATAG